MMFGPYPYGTDAIQMIEEVARIAKGKSSGTEDGTERAETQKQPTLLVKLAKIVHQKTPSSTVNHGKPLAGN